MAVFEDNQDPPEGTPEYVFLLERPSQPVVVFPDSLMAMRLNSFDLLTVDLDGDGIKERVLAAWNAQGNGIGINAWTIRIFANDWSLLRQFDEVLDWSDGNLVAPPKGRRGCDLAITSFVESKNKQGRDGISFEAVFYELASGNVQQAKDRPTLRRRYDRAFERQRSASFRRSEEQGKAEIKGDVSNWLSHPSTITAARSSR